MEPRSPKYAETAATIASLSSRITILEDELEEAGKEMAANIRREVELQMELDCVLAQKEEDIQAATEPLVNKISQLEAELSYSTSSSGSDGSGYDSGFSSPTHSNREYHNIERIKQELNTKHLNELEEVIEQNKKDVEKLKFDLEKNFELEKQDLIKKTEDSLRREHSKKLSDLEENLENQIRDLRNENGNLEFEIKILRKEIETFDNESSENSENEKKLENFGVEIRNLQNEIENRESEVENLKKENNLLIDEKNLLVKNNEMLKNENVSFTKEKEFEIEKLKNEIENYKSENDLLIKGKVNDDIEIRNLKDEIENFKNEYLLLKKESSKQLENLEIEKSREMENLQKINRDEVANLESKLLNASNKLAAIENSFQELNSEYQQCTQNSSQTSTELTSAYEKVQEFEDKNRILEKNCEELFDEKIKLNAEKEMFLKDIQKIKLEKLELENELKESHDKLDEFMKSMKEKWESQYRDLEQKHKESELKLKESVEKNELIYEKLMKEREKSKSNEMDHEQSKERLRALEKQNEENIKELKDLQLLIKSENERWKDKEENFMINYEKLEMKLKQKESDYDIINDELEFITAEKQSIKQKLFDNDKEKILIDREKRQIEIKFKKLLEEKENLSKQLDEIENQHREEISIIAKEIQKRLESLEKNQKNLLTNNNNKNNHDRTSKLLQKITDLENSLKSSKLECEKLNEKLTEIQLYHFEAVNEKNKVIEEKSEAQKKIKLLESRLESFDKLSGLEKNDLRLMEKYHEVLAKNMELTIQLSSK